MVKNEDDIVDIPAPTGKSNPTVPNRHELEERMADHTSIPDGEWTEADGGLVLRLNDGVAFVTLNRPERRNALGPKLRIALTEFLERAGKDPAVRVVVIQGAGDTFMAGGNIKGFAEGLGLAPEPRGDDMRERAYGAGVLSALIAKMPQPVIVAARGPAVGYGASMVYAADLVVLSETAMLRLSHVGLSLVPDGGATWFLPRLVGPRRATEIALLGDPMSAGEALAAGIANKVVADAELEATAEALARRLAAAPRVAVAEIKQLLRNSYANDIDTQIDAESDALKRCAMTDDYVEGVRALLEKRRPRFGA